MLSNHNYVIQLETYRANPLRSMSPLEKQAFDILTPFCFKRLQDEFARASQYMMFEVSPYEFVVQHHGTGATSKHRVFWDSETGILCRHILSVFVHKDCFCVPSICFPMHWRCEVAQVTEVLSSPVEDLIVEDLVAHTHTGNNVGFIHCPPQSKTKGRPKQLRRKSSKELAKQVKTYSFCKRMGHNITTCPHKKNFGGNASILSN
ncbi:hypothetical protein Cgig2_017190 [Carnegiea gigantea]|uniref:Protein FAR1-RELATED SEQUENCE n=1 Tax=Carnegiea gigantea TaxID=171969 RepID=A0A9Q1JUB2_9CARY|nr:hypothetical protein Cgig2_017190 [Carnegiea gigantea]